MFGEKENYEFHIFGLRLLIGELAFFSDAVRQASVGHDINKTTRLLKEAKIRPLKTDLSIYGKFDFERPH